MMLCYDNVIIVRSIVIILLIYIIVILVVVICNYKSYDDNDYDIYQYENDVKFNFLSVMKEVPFSDVIYKRRIQLRCLAQLLLCIVEDVELNPGLSMVCAMRANVRTHGSTTTPQNSCTQHYVIINTQIKIGQNICILEIIINIIIDKNEKIIFLHSLLNNLA